MTMTTTTTTTTTMMKTIIMKNKVIKASRIVDINLQNMNKRRKR
ncbi:hypothetical protein AWRI1631_70510 [Saccharomyces cerevisiae AWRI1631]|uniref:Uncharacterized protein n=1 Tax=Saccharomyces cerevisiae (strain AWRI1631) TaxID=545124 RepID=B5VIC9_YEAS6|nr:hypothetical protein AWRI1631_70510 [Saccharomyces cerevisiae AWRI1631]